MDQLIDGVETLFARAASIAAHYLQGNDDSSLAVCALKSPAELSREFNFELPAQGRPMEAILEDMESVLQHSVRTGHPRFLNQLFGGYEPASILGDWLTALVNTSMYTYEAAPVATLMELELIRRMNEYIGFTSGEGVLAPGGSISNLMCVLAARHVKFPHVKQSGWSATDRPVMFVSDEAHYSQERAASVAGIGLDAVVKVQTDAEGRMDPVALESSIRAAVLAGQQPFFVGATSGTTVLGAFDPLEAIADVCEQHGIWLHVDGSYGGSAILSATHRHLLQGVQRADSMTWNPHKMMGVPLACSATLMRESGRLVATNGMAADYLFHEGQDESFDLGDRSLQCGRRVDAFKLWFSWQHMGDAGYSARVDRLFAQAADFRELVAARPGFELVRNGSGTNVCFRFLPSSGRRTGGSERARLQHDATVRIRAELVRSGRIMVNYATVDEIATFRLVANHPDTSISDYEFLLSEIERIGDA